MSVTPSPAGFAAKASPLRMLRGNLRRSIDRYSLWPSSWRSDPLLERAVEQVPSLNPEEHRAKRIVDERGLLDPDQEALMYYAHSALERGLSRRHDGKIE